MIIRITSQVAENPRWYAILDTIVEFVQLPDSRLSFDPRDIIPLTRSSWLSGATGARRLIASIIQMSARTASRGSISDASILLIDERAPREAEVVTSNITKVHPLGAIPIVATPFSIVVEDETSDGGFILWMARFLGRDEIIRTYRAGRLQFRHAGGKRQMSKSAKALSFGSWAKEGRPIRSLKLRAACVLDSDSKFLGHVPNNGIVSAVNPYVAFVHCLNGRTIENYVPEKYFKRRLVDDGIGALARPFFSLSPNQRRHFAIKTGYKDRSDPPLPQTMAQFLSDENRDAAEKDLFRGISNDDWSSLAAGYGERLGRVYMDHQYRCDPNEQRGLTTDQAAEINSLLTQIIRWL